jgi:carboxymethylenebutenolidase
MGTYIDLTAYGAPAGLSAYQALPEAGHGATVILLQEIFGVNAAMRAAADDLAANGFVVLAPDLFWRSGPRIELGYGDADMKSAVAYWQQFDLEAGISDVEATIAAARQLPCCTGGIGLLGFCLGGQLAVKASARMPVDAVVSFYGVQLGKSLDEIASLRCAAQFHFGDADPHVPVETRNAIGRLAEDNEQLVMFVYPGAGHAFFNAFRPIGFDASAHEASQARAVAMLHSALGRATAAMGPTS